jgi:hypothetical protein
MPSGDEIRGVQRATWPGLSAGWDKCDAIIMDQLRPVGDAIVEHLDIADEQQHLDIAAGTGEPGLTVAKLAHRRHEIGTPGTADLRRTGQFTAARFGGQGQARSAEGRKG